MFLAEALTQVDLRGQLVVLAMMLTCGVWTALRPGVLPVLGLAACAAVWLRADSHLEGFILITFAPGRGLVIADLLVPALGCLTLLHRDRGRVVGHVRRHHRSDRASHPRHERTLAWSPLHNPRSHPRHNLSGDPHPSLPGDPRDNPPGDPRSPERHWERSGAAPAR